VTHIRTDNGPNASRTFACGIGPDLPEGDVYFFDAEVAMHHLVDCPGCKSNAAPLGTPTSEISGRPGCRGYDKFKQIAERWGYD
jgi:hypothetical protein